MREYYISSSIRPFAAVFAAHIYSLDKSKTARGGDGGGKEDAQLHLHAPLK